MFSLKFWLNLATSPQEHIWVDAILIRETPKAILILFDGKKIWLPKVSILRIKRNRKEISIKISQFNWAGKVQ